MKKAILITLIAVIWFSCHKRHIEPGCTVTATVADLSKSGGCGLGFQLPDGSLLTPEQHPAMCGHPHNPLLNFQLVDSMKVKIGYEIENHHNTPCVAGTVVEITCIELLIASDK